MQSTSGQQHQMMNEPHMVSLLSGSLTLDQSTTTRRILPSSQQGLDMVGWPSPLASTTRRLSEIKLRCCLSRKVLNWVSSKTGDLQLIKVVRDQGLLHDNLSKQTRPPKLRTLQLNSITRVCGS